MMKLIRFSNCIPVKGKNRSIIMDLQRGVVKLIPNDLYEILIEFNGQDVSLIKKRYDNKFDEVIDEYIQFLLTNEFCFLSKNEEFFSSVSNTWRSENEINNALIDIDECSNFSFNEVIFQLNEVKTKYLEARFFKKIDIQEIVEFLDLFETSFSSIVGIQLICRYDPIVKKSEYQYLINRYSRLTSIIVYDSPKSSLQINDNQNGSFLKFIKNSNLSEKSCGVINQHYFTVNFSTYLEAINHNSCLNCKISIDVNGNIKNCPSMSEGFGNVKHTKLKDAISHKDFKKYWDITKDQIETCKDCEFRYICTDCRAFVENPENDYSKPLKCGYDPYTNQWEKWTKSPLKQKAINYYELQSIIK